MSTNNNNRSGNPHEVNAYTVGRVAYSVEAINIIAARIGRLYKVNDDAVFCKMMNALEEGAHPYFAGIKFALERREKVAPPAAPVKAETEAPYPHDY